MTFTSDGNYRKEEFSPPLLTSDQFYKIAPKAKADYSLVLSNAMKRYGILTPHQIAAFLAQLCHESDGFLTTKEYASGRAYEGRKDLGNTERGDGVRFKGRGFIQCTGRNNYTVASIALFGDQNVLLEKPELLEQPEYAALVSGWFWDSRKLNKYCDGTTSGFIELTKRINGGTNGLPDRLEKWNKAKLVMGA